MLPGTDLQTKSLPHGIRRSDGKYFIVQLFVTML